MFSIPQAGLWIHSTPFSYLFLVSVQTKITSHLHNQSQFKNRCTHVYIFIYCENVTQVYLAWKYNRPYKYETVWSLLPLVNGMAKVMLSVLSVCSQGSLYRIPFLAPSSVQGPTPLCRTSVQGPCAQTCSTWTSLYREPPPPPPTHSNLLIKKHGLSENGQLAFNWNASFHTYWFECNNERIILTLKVRYIVH